MNDSLIRLGLEANPFEPSASGVPTVGPLAPLGPLAQEAVETLNLQERGTGVRAIVVVGEYGSGKTCLLQWLHRVVFPERKILSYYFDNPGVQFYDLANRLLRTVGRRDFAKFIWEFAGSYVDQPHQSNLFQRGFEEYLASGARSRKTWDVEGPLRDAIRRSGVVDDDEIASCFARIVAGYSRKPYFEYRDFIPRQSGAIVAEGEEAPYFRTILSTLLKGTGATAVALVVDEFEEIGLQKRLTKRAAHDYLATLKRLLNLAQSENVQFWIVLSMTPDAYRATATLEPSLGERIGDQTLRVTELSVEGALELIRGRVAGSRPEGIESVPGAAFPFPEEIVFRPRTYSNPRRLVKTCFRAVAQASENVELPFSESYLQRIEDELYPGDAEVEGR